VQVVEEERRKQNVALPAYNVCMHAKSSNVHMHALNAICRWLRSWKSLGRLTLLKSLPFLVSALTKVLTQHIQIHQNVGGG